MFCEKININDIDCFIYLFLGENYINQIAQCVNYNDNIYVEFWQDTQNKFFALEFLDFDVNAYYLPENTNETKLDKEATDRLSTSYRNFMIAKFGDDYKKALTKHIAESVDEKENIAER